VFLDKIEPDLPRLFDEARLEFILSHLQREAAEIVEDEIVEAGRFQGQYVRAVGRTSGEQTVAAIVVPDGTRFTNQQTAALQGELDQLEACFGTVPMKLIYGITARPERPLEVERVPTGELI
jgi:hypothetical protein